jgi:O-methyltransferase
MLDFDAVYPSIRRITLLSEAKIRSLWCLATELGSVGGDIAELGVYQGGVSRLLALACPGRTVHLFDTFAGIPETRDPALDWHRPGEFAASIAEVRATLAGCPNVLLHPGLFPRTAVDGAFALVHLDADLYSSTREGLEWFWPRLSVGGALVLDDYRWRYCRGVDRAVDEFFDSRGNAEFIESAPHQLTVWKTKASPPPSSLHSQGGVAGEESTAPSWLSETSARVRRPDIPQRSDKSSFVPK